MSNAKGLITNNPHHLDAQRFNLQAISKVPWRQTREITSERFGVGFETLDRQLFDPDPCYPLLAELGAKWARVQTGWSRCEKVKGQYDFDWLDDVTDNLLAAGLRPWFSLSFGNALYMPDAPHPSAVGRVPIYYGDECVQAWHQYVQALVTHFRDRVTHYEIWNEPNIVNFWQPAPNAVDYAHFSGITSQAVRGIMTDAVMLGGALAGGGYAAPFLRKALEAGLGEHIDILTYHPYRDTPETASELELSVMRSLCRQYNPKMRLWQGETGTPSVHGFHHDFLCENADQITQTTQAKWAIRRLMTDMKYGVDTSSYFHTADLTKAVYVQSDGKPLKPVMMGLLHGTDYSPKESYYAVRNVCNLMDEDTKPADLFHAIHYNGFFNKRGKQTYDKFTMDYVAVYTAAFERKGYPLYAWWLPSIPVRCRRAEAVQLLMYPTARNTIENPVLVDVLTGLVYGLPALEKHPSWSGHLFVDDLPMTDYPLMLTDRAAL